MKILKSLKLFVLLLFVVPVYLSAQKTFEKQFDVKANEKLVIDLETGASIKVEGWNKNIVSAVAEVGGRNKEEVEFNFEKTSYGVEITSEYLYRDENYNSKIELKVMVPNKFNVDFKTMGGNVELLGVEGKLEGTTMGGSIDLKNLKGYLDIKTMGGSIELTNSEVDGNVETMGGSILVEDVIGDVNASSMGGKVIQKNVKSSKKSVGKEIDISTMGGSINIDEALHGANIKTMGGKISVNKVKQFLKAETMGGDIYVKEADAWIKAKTMGGDVEVKLNCDPKTDDRDVELISMHGDVTLYVPSNFSMDLDIEIRYSEDDEDEVDIVSDFNIKEEVTEDSKKSHWNKTMILHGSASLNGGKNKVEIKTVNGRVYLKKI
ncbi:MAG: hypothetical protein KJ571_17165 [Bacteroidetes bacterium]|nr:hypothetical protein [Bacteroidota bacterium]